MYQNILPFCQRQPGYLRKVNLSTKKFDNNLFQIRPWEIMVHCQSISTDKRLPSRLACRVESI